MPRSSRNEKSDRQVQMGVSAIFVSSLALQRLPSPHGPLENDVEQLAAILQPIVSFVVLGSIVIRKKRDKPSVFDADIFCTRWPVSSFVFTRETGSFTNTSTELHVELLFCA